MQAFTRKYSTQIIVALIGIIMILVLILVTDLHVAEINRRIGQTIQRL
jgi:hypothetical protein